MAARTGTAWEANLTEHSEQSSTRQLASFADLGEHIWTAGQGSIGAPTNELPESAAGARPCPLSGGTGENSGPDAQLLAGKGDPGAALAPVVTAASGVD